MSDKISRDPTRAKLARAIGRRKTAATQAAEFRDAADRVRGMIADAESRLATATAATEDAAASARQILAAAAVRAAQSGGGFAGDDPAHAAASEAVRKARATAAEAADQLAAFEIANATCDANLERAEAELAKIDCEIRSLADDVIRTNAVQPLLLDMLRLEADLLGRRLELDFLTKSGLISLEDERETARLLQVTSTLHGTWDTADYNAHSEHPSRTIWRRVREALSENADTELPVPA